MNELENVDVNKIEKELYLAKLKEELLKKLSEYRSTISFLACDTPIQTLCLSKSLESILINEGWLRVYDLFDRDFTKVKGIGETRLRELTSRLNEFFSML